MTDFTSKRGDTCAAVPATATTLQVQVRQGQPVIDIPDIYAELARVTAERDRAVKVLREAGDVLKKWKGRSRTRINAGSGWYNCDVPITLRAETCNLIRRIKEATDGN